MLCSVTKFLKPSAQHRVSGVFISRLMGGHRENPSKQGQEAALVPQIKRDLLTGAGKMASFPSLGPFSLLNSAGD